LTPNFFAFSVNCQYMSAPKILDGKIETQFPLVFSQNVDQTLKHR
jgi:hypothetical protein